MPARLARSRATVWKFLPLNERGVHQGRWRQRATQAEVARFSRKDADALPAYYATLDRVASVMKRPAARNTAQRWWRHRRCAASLKAGRRVKQLDMAARRDVLDLFTKSAGDVLDQWFESDPIKSLFRVRRRRWQLRLALPPGSAYVLLHHVFGEVNGKPGIWGHAVGGMGSITKAMAAEAADRGVDHHA